jgi:hypothetical protein
MGKTPDADPETTLGRCSQNWQVTNTVQTCELFYTSIRELTPDQAKTKCSTNEVSRRPIGTASRSIAGKRAPTI